MATILKAVRAHRRLLVVTFFLFASVVVCRVLSMHPRYKAEVLVHLDVKKKSTSPEAERLAIQEVISFIQTAFSIMKSDFILERIVSKTDYGKLEKATNNDVGNTLQARVKKLRNNMQTEHLRFTNLGIVRIFDRDSETAVAIANDIAQSFQEWQADQVRQEISRINSFLDQRIEITVNALYEAENRVKEYLEEKALRLEDAGMEGGQANMPVLIQESLAAQEDLNEILETDVDGNLLKTVDTIQQVSAVRAWLNQLLDYETARADLLRTYTSSHIRVKRIDKDLQSAKDAIASNVRRFLPNNPDTFVEQVCTILTLRTKARAIKRYTENRKAEFWKPRSEFLPEQGMEIERLRRRVNLLEKTYSMLVNEKELNPVVYAKGSVRLSVVSPARTSMVVKVDTRWLTLTLGLLSSLIMSLAVAYATALVRGDEC